MKYKIDQDAQNLHVTIEEINDTEQRNNVFNSFLLCQKGDCDCPTKEYTKVDDFRIKPGNGKLELFLSPKEKEDINPDEVVKCIEYNMERNS